MVTTKLQGRLGNQCFQIAHTIAYSIKHNIPYGIPEHTDDPAKWQREFKHLYTIPNDHSHNFVDIKEKHDASYFNLPAPDGRHIRLDGFWQSYLYFIHHLDEVVDALGFRFTRMLRGRVAIHMRRGDYLQLSDYHPAVSYDYILMGVKYFYELGYRDFHFFSDDMDYVRTLDIRKRYPNCLFSYSVGNAPLQDMQTMANCNHLIGSNSSFSLFSFIINPNPDKICVFPKQWFGSKLSHINTDDMYPANAIKF